MTEQMLGKIRFYIEQIKIQIEKQEENNDYFCGDFVEEIYRTFDKTEIDVTGCIDVITKASGRLSVKNYSLDALLNKLEFALSSSHEKKIYSHILEECAETNAKIFISHSSADKEYGLALVELLRSIGLKREQIIFTSNANYGIPINQDIFEYLKSQIQSNVYIIYLLSNNYYSSVACLNEMGAAWIVQNEYTAIFTPDFNIRDSKFQDGAINPRKMGFVINDKTRVIQFKNIILNKFDLSIDEQDWDEVLDKFIYLISAICR